MVGSFEAPGAHERRLALQQHHLRKEAYEHSRRCYEEGDHDNAEKFSKEGDLHDDLKKKWNAKKGKAADTIFGSKNRERPLEEIDLHGLFVEEATQKFKARIEVCKLIGKKYLRVIVGRGNNSKGKKAKNKTGDYKVGGEVAAEMSS